MMGLRTAASALLTAVFATTIASGALAAEDTYPDPALSLNVSPGRVIGGEPVTLSATSSVDCSSITLTFLGETRAATGSRIQKVFGTPEVKGVTARIVRASCTYVDANGTSVTLSSSGDVQPASFRSAIGPLGSAVRTAAASVVLLPRSSDGGGSDGMINGLLPNTGGLSFWLLLLGLALVLGGTMIGFRRRRH